MIIVPLNTMGLLAGIAVAQREGLPPDQVARVALPGAVVSNLALGVVVVDRLAKQEAAAEQAAPQTGSAPGGAFGGDPLPQPFSLPVVAQVQPPPTSEVGEALRADPGTWQNTKPDEEPTYQWFRDTGEGPEEIDKAQSAEYTIDEADNDSWLTVQVTYDGVSTTSTPIPVGKPPAAESDSSAQAGSGKAKPV